MDTITTALRAYVDADPRGTLDKLRWEQIPNDFRGLPRLPAPPRRAAAITKALPSTRMTLADWDAWSIRPDEVGW